MGNRKIAVIGAGPAGCMLARLLHLGGIDVTVFEGEASPNFRSQGGSLDLHTATGLAAIKEAGLWDEFLKHGRYDGQYMAIVDKDMDYLLVREADEKVANHVEERPEIDRSKLRELLAESLPAGMIKWDHRLKSIDGRQLVFENTAIDGFDLIVGADGAWSKVRHEIDPSLVPEYVGLAYHDFDIVDAEHTAPEVYKAVNRGSIFAGDEGKRMSVQQLGDGSINVHATYVNEDRDWMKREKCGYDAHSLEETIPALLEHQFSDWSPLLRQALEKANGRCEPRLLTMLPVGTKWTHKPGFTLIGDAAHLMTPFAGEGVNLALEDAMLLARAINGAATEHDDDDDDAFDGELAAFEKSMHKRATKVQDLTYHLMQDWLFTPGAPRSVMARSMSRHARHRLPWGLGGIGTAGVYGYFFWKNLFGR